MLFALVVGLLLQASPSTSQPAAPADPWARIRFMVGEWQGESEGQPGRGTVKRTYAFVLHDRFLYEENVSTYPPQPKNEKGEVHEYRSYFSYDRARRTLVLRQFHQEGFFNQYATPASNTGGAIVFESEALENVPSMEGTGDLRARFPGRIRGDFRARFRRRPLRDLQQGALQAGPPPVEPDPSVASPQQQCDRDHPGGPRGHAD